MRPRPLVLFLLVVAAALAGCSGAGPGSASAPSLASRPAEADPADWCAEHAVPESMCTVCNPSLTPAYQAAGDWCDEHGYPESVCPLCNPVEPPGGAGGGFAGTVIRFRSADLEERVGLRTARASASMLGSGVEATATIAFAADRTAEVRPPVPGVVRELVADLGDEVAAGDPLLVIESAGVGDLRARLAAAAQRRRTAEADLARQRELRAAGIASARHEELAAQEVEAAAGEVEAAEAALGAAGASDAGTRGRYTVRSPLRGTVVRRPATLGSAVSGGDLLAVVADTASVWAMLAVREEDVAALRPGQPVRVAVDGVGDRVFDGTLTWIAPEVDPRTRAVAARAELSNEDGLLRAHQFGRATVEVEPPAQVVAVPRAAIQRLDDGSVVFVRTAAGVFEPRAVDVGRADGDLVQVHGPLVAGDEVVTTGSFLLKTELRRDAIGAGCCEVEEPGS